ncbi:MAG: hypothetical protein IKB13_10420 [Clostridia bacterium]|nr:hypothetical protein [Clostridia bacterium]
MPEVYGGSGGVSKKAQKMYVGVNNMSKEVQKMYVGVYGAAVLVYPSNTETFLKQFSLGDAGGDWSGFFEVTGL